MIVKYRGGDHGKGEHMKEIKDIEVIALTKEKEKKSQGEMGPLDRL